MATDTAAMAVDVGGKTAGVEGGGGKSGVAPCAHRGERQTMTAGKTTPWQTRGKLVASCRWVALAWLALGGGALVVSPGVLAAIASYAGVWARDGLKQRAQQPVHKWYA